MGRDSFEEAARLGPLASAVSPFALTPRLPDGELEAIPGVTRIQVQLLHNRGTRGRAAVERLLAADWRDQQALLPDLDVAVARIRRAIVQREPVVVFGDFDCDGMTACAVLTCALRALGARVRPYVPRREDDGRGLNIAAVEKLADEGARLLITTDCGTANVAEVRRARELGVAVIVTDHHPIHGEVAEALAVVNPQRAEEPGDSRDLSGAGVAFRLAERLLSTSDLPDAGALTASLLDLVAIGTVADLVPLSATNWALVRAGLHRLRSAARPGIRALLALAREDAADLDTRTISFALAPRLNACGRLGKPNLALDLLLTEDAAEANALAAEVEQLNQERKALTEAALAAARAQLGARDDTARFAVAVGDGWALGVLGLVAGRLAEDLGKPAFVISRTGDECRGSARGAAGVNLGALLAGRADLFTRFGGHAQAAGFTLASANLPQLLAYLDERFAAAAGAGAQASPAPNAGASDLDASPTPNADPHADAELMVDCELSFHRATELYDEIVWLAPYGPGFAEPVFVARGLRLVGCRPTGSGQHLRLTLREGRSTTSAMLPRQGQRAAAIQAALATLPPLDVAYTLSAYRRADSGARVVMPRVVSLALSRP